MIFQLINDGVLNEYHVEASKTALGLTFKDPIADGDFHLYFKNDEVMIKRTGNIEMQEIYKAGLITMGYYKQEGITFKSVIETTLLIIDESKIKIEYLQTIEHHKSQKTMVFWLK